MKRTHHVHDTINVLTRLTQHFEDKRRQGILEVNSKHPLFTNFCEHTQKSKNATIQQVFIKQLTLLPGYVVVLGQGFDADVRS